MDAQHESNRRTLTEPYAAAEPAPDEGGENVGNGEREDGAKWLQNETVDSKLVEVAEA